MRAGILAGVTEIILLFIIIGTALAFDFTNGFHDTANAMATSIATGALKPKTAVALAGALNFVGAFLSVEVAKTVAKGIVKLDAFDLNNPLEADKLLLVVFTGLIGAILWNLATWLFGLPSSSSHALFGGLIGSAIAALGFSGVIWGGVASKIIVPALAAPFVAGLVAAVGTSLVFAITKRVQKGPRDKYFRWGQIGSASLVALAHGTSDAQKTMGVVFLALVATGKIDEAADMPVWVTAACALAIALGTYTGGWRVIRTLGKGLVEISSIIMTSSQLGMALSTTHVATGSILGSGLGRPGGDVRWGVAGRMMMAWVTTLPIAAAVSWVIFQVSHGVSSITNNVVGAIAAFLILLIGIGIMIMEARKKPIHSDNVNAEWDEDSHSVVPKEGDDEREPATVGANQVDNAERYGHKDAGEPADFIDTRSGMSLDHHVIDPKEQ